MAECKVVLSSWICGRSRNGSKGAKLLSANESEALFHSGMASS